VRVLVAEDDVPTQKSLITFLQRHGYHVTAATDGQTTLDILLQPNPPSIVLLDWEMPGLDGLHVCRALRATPQEQYIYIIMVTARDSTDDLLDAFGAGADDFLSKPADAAQLLARMRSGQRVLMLETRLKERIVELEKSLEEVHQLKRMLPICMYCKKVRHDDNYWQEIDSYIHEHTGTDFSHGICPGCMETVVKPELRAVTSEPEDDTSEAG
jgi:sigma-B regulation protein RsbU (phosphoserine phosphatase)